LDNARIINAKVGEWLKHGGSSFERCDFLLLDPPRTGAEPEVVQGILALQPGRISYVACDPATLARDLKDLLAGGYSFESVAALDMFPQTHHVETVVHLLRR
jgi:23S rRNA (uracil1939-C5)-methyltransferase